MGPSGAAAGIGVAGTLSLISCGAELLVEAAGIKDKARPNSDGPYSSSGIYRRTSSTLQDKILHRSFMVAVEILRFCFKESKVPRLKEKFFIKA